MKLYVGSLLKVHGTKVHARLVLGTALLQWKDTGHDLVHGTVYVIGVLWGKFPYHLIFHVSLQYFRTDGRVSAQGQ